MGPGPGLAATYEGGDPRLLERLLPLVDFLEISPDVISVVDRKGCHLNSDIITELSNVSGRIKFLVHGVGLSIASAVGVSENYVRLLDDIFDRFAIAWHSEHLGYRSVEGEDLGTMFPPPRTQEVLDMLCERVTRLQRRFPVPFALEHVIRFIPDCPGDYSESAFLNALSHETGCSLILDVYNLECDQENFGFDIQTFLRELDLASVKEIHLAGGERQNSFRMDAHTQLTDRSTRLLAKDVLQRAPHVGAVTFEYLKEVIPELGHDAICGELRRLRQTLLDG
jgi:uncharacterized protein